MFDFDWTGCLLLAQDAAPEAMYEGEYPAPQSRLGFMFQSLGFFYTLAIGGSGFLVFLGAVATTAMSRRPAISAAYLAFTPIPLLIGCFGMVTGMIEGLTVIAYSPAAPKAAEVGAHVAAALIAVLAGFLASGPSYLLVACALFFKVAAKRE